MATVMTAGEIVVEIMATQRGQSFREAGLLQGPFASGAPAIFIDQVARLGVSAGIIACVGDDDFGLLNIDRLGRDGVDTSTIHVLRGASTGSAFVRYREDGERDFVFNIVNSAASHLDTAHVNHHTLKDCRHFHVMGSSLFSSRVIDAIKKAVEIVRAQGGTISFDPNVRKEMLSIPEMRHALRFVLESTDIFLPSGHEVTLLTNSADESAAVRELHALGVREVVIKRGAAGASWFGGNDRVDVAPLPVQEVDPTGAGDGFGATYVACRLLQREPPQALRYANAAGAHAVTRLGPMEGSSSFIELDALLAAQPPGLSRSQT